MLFTACEEGPRVHPTTTAASDEPPPVTTRRAPQVDVLPDDRVALHGRIETPRGEPVAGARFVTVDDTGELREGVSGPDGALEVEELRPPYDLRVADTAYLGVARVDPVVEVERDEEERAPPEEVFVEVHAPSCGRDPCIIDLVSTSLEGEGRATALGEGFITLQHVFRGRSASEIDVHVLAHDADYTTVAYGRGRELVEAAPVETADILVDPDAVVTLDVPGADGVPGASFVVASRLPRVAGATWRMERSAAAPVTSTRLHYSSRAWSGTEPIDHDPPALPLPVGPRISRPLAGGVLSARGAGLSWTSDPRTLFTVDVTDVARGAFRYRLITNASDLSFGRIEALGFPRLQPGAHTLSLTTAPFTGIDEAVSSDAVVRGRRFDLRRAGAATYETIPFTATR